MKRLQPMPKTNYLQLIGQSVVGALGIYVFMFAYYVIANVLI